MFTMAKIRDGSTYLANHLSANDYYTEGEKVRGVWVGEAAAALRLGGEVLPEQFQALRQNTKPGTKERLTPRSKTERVAFFDFQCSAQKSVSLVAVLAGDERLRNVHQSAAITAFTELERFAARQKNGVFVRGREPTGNACAAAFTHDASRALDPQLHTHFVVANATRDAAGRWVALDEFEMLKAIRYAGKVYQNELARGVRALGYATREVRDAKGIVTGFEIAGVSPALCARFSKRRAEIEREITRFREKRGREPSATEVARITRETRSEKLSEISTPEVRARQRGQLLPGEWEKLQALRAEALHRMEAGAKQAHTADEGRQALGAAVAHVFERRSVAPVHEVLAEALNQSLGGVELGQLKRAVEAGEAGLVGLTTNADNALLPECCTRYGLELERWSVTFVNATKERCQPLNAAFISAGPLSSEQREAVRAILSTRDQVFSFRGVAGAGKTTTLREVHRGLAEAGHRALYIAPTAAAAKVLQGEGFAGATTVTDFLQNVTRRESLRGSVVICDEAGLKSNRQGAALLRLAHERGLRVLFVGDVRQHVSVEAGDFLRVMEKHSQLGRCEVSEIRRQQGSPAYKAAVERMAFGDARGGLVALDALGWLHGSSSDYLQRAAEDYQRLTQGGANLECCLAVAPTWAENHRFTAAIRSGLQAGGQLAIEGTAFTVHDSLQWTARQKRTLRNYRVRQIVVFTRAVDGWKAGECAEVHATGSDGKVTLVAAGGALRALPRRAVESFDVGLPRTIAVAAGDKLLVRANDKRLGLVNGQVLTVTHVAPDRSIATREGVTIPAHFRQWCHGYVVTSHKAQGRTCEHVVVAAERLDAKAAYVACSRGRSSCVVHTPDKARLLARLPEGSRRAALDALAPVVALDKLALGIAARLQLWARVLPQAAARSLARATVPMRERLEQTREVVRRWRERRAAVVQGKQVAPTRAQRAARMRAG